MTRLSEWGDFYALLSDAELARMRANPHLRQAAEHISRGAIAHYESMDGFNRWILKDIGTSCTALIALSLAQSPEGLTATKLMSVCVAKHQASRGRVRVFLEKCLKQGVIHIEAGNGQWTRRPLTAGPGLIMGLRSRAMVEYEALAILDPGAASLAKVCADDRLFLRMMLFLGFFSEFRPDIYFNHPANPPMNLFLQRDAGMYILHDLVRNQPRERERFLDRARISRYALAAKFGVSRQHINRLLGDAEKARLLSLAAEDTVVFSEALEDSLLYQTAILAQWLKVSTLAAMSDIALAA